MIKRLISVDLNKRVRFYTVEITTSNARVEYGMLGGKPIVGLLPKSEVFKKIKEKLNDGYIEVNDYENITKELIDTLYNKKDLLGVLKPMLAETYVGDYVPHHCIQYKYNGIRARGVYKEQTETFGLFETEYKGMFLFSREVEWLYLPEIEKELTKLNKQLKDIYPNSEFYFDGEIYFHGASLETINSSVRRRVNGGITNASNNLDVYYVLYDIVDLNDIEAPFAKRLKLLDKVKEINLYDKYIKVAETTILSYDTNSEDIDKYRDAAIAAKYEGLIIRDLYSQYYFGHRTRALQKHKISYIETFIIKDIKLSSKNEVIAVLINDVNDFTFDCTFSKRSKTEAMNFYTNKNACIGNKVQVKFYERTKDKNLPRHATIINIT